MPRRPVRQRLEPADADPSTVTGLVYRVFTRWRVMLGAVLVFLVLVGVLVLAFRFLGPFRFDVGPVGVESVQLAGAAGADWTVTARRRGGGCWSTSSTGTVTSWRGNGLVVA